MMIVMMYWHVMGGCVWGRSPLVWAHSAGQRGSRMRVAPAAAETGGDERRRQGNGEANAPSGSGLYGHPLSFAIVYRLCFVPVTRTSLEHCSLNLPRHEVLSQRFAFPCATPAGTHVRQSSCGWRMLRTGISLADCGFKLVGARTVTSVSVA